MTGKGKSFLSDQKADVICGGGQKGKEEADRRINIAPEHARAICDKKKGEIGSLRR